VFPNTVLLLNSCFAFGSGGLKVISLYRGVGTDTIARLHRYWPLPEDTNTPSPVCWMLRTGDWRTTVPWVRRFAKHLENDCVPVVVVLAKVTQGHRFYLPSAILRY